MNSTAQSDMHPTKAGPTESNPGIDATAVTKRLQQELTSLMCGGDSGVSAFPSGDNLFNWVGTITVSHETRAFPGYYYRFLSVQKGSRVVVCTGPKWNCL